VRGIYVTGHSAGGSKFGELTDFVDKTELNTMVIDVKDDNGNLTFKPDGHSEYAEIANDSPRPFFQTLPFFSLKDHSGFLFASSLSLNTTIRAIG
jgi:hypothetical protein